MCFCFLSINNVWHHLQTFWLFYLPSYIVFFLHNHRATLLSTMVRLRQFINNRKYKTLIHKSSRKTWIFKLFLFCLVCFWFFIFLNVFSLSFERSHFPTADTQRIFMRFICSSHLLFNLLTCKITKQFQKIQKVYSQVLKYTTPGYAHTWSLRHFKLF